MFYVEQVVEIWTPGVLSAVDRLSEELQIYIEPCAVLDYSPDEEYYIIA